MRAAESRRRSPGLAAAAVVVPGSGCAPAAAAPQAHRWLGGGRGCPRPRKELANSLRSGAQFPSPCLQHVNCRCFRLGGGGRGGAGPAVGVDLAEGRSPSPTHPQTIRGDVGQASSQAPSPLASGVSVLSFVFLLTHQGKFGTTQGKVGARLGVHFPGGGSCGGARRLVCRCSRLAGADCAPWELSLSLPVALARHCDNPWSAVSRLIFGAKRRHLQPA